MANPVTIDLRHVARGLDIALHQVEATVELLDEGNTVPFVTRYRKDQTGGLDEEKVRAIQTRLAKLRLLAERKQTILRTIEAQGKLTEKLAKQIQSASTTKRLEDLYLPFRPKKQTLATLARSRGLELLAQEILTGAISREALDARAADFANPDRQVPTAADALLGAGHILAEQFSERAELRQRLREILQRTGKLISVQIGAESKQPSFAETGDKPSGEAATQDHASVAEPPATASPDAPRAEADASTPASPPVAPMPAREANPAPQTQAEGDAAAESAVGLMEALAREVAPIAPAEPPAATPKQPGDSATAPDGASPAEATSPELLAAATPESSAGIAPAATSNPPPAAPTPTHPPVKPKAKPAKAEIKRQQRELKKQMAEERKLKAFADYFNYREELKRIPPHRVLAINRGERAGVLRVRIECDLEAMYRAADEICAPLDHPHAEFLRGCARDALVRLVLPSLEREVRRELTERAETHAVEVFARNLRNLLLQPPVRDRRVLAIDPGFKSGCKMVALDEFGNVLGHDTFFLVGKPDRREEAKQKIAALIDQFQLTAIVIGNGTACRQTEEFIAELLGHELKDKGAAYVIVNEAGASVYSTSRLGREEFPQYDATLRGAISIGRRLQDPLSELVKIEPSNIGVGLYQHDVKAKHLQESLDAVVESCVNYVGVDVNTASPALLRHVSGLNQLTARRLYEHRVQNGPFKNRQQLKEVPGIGEATFVQSAGFLKISGGDNPLDATWIHPESYEVAGRVMAALEISPSDLGKKEAAAAWAGRIAKVDTAALAQSLQVGVMTLQDIIAQLARPGRDPRDDLPPPVFKRGIVKLEDLVPGMELTGTVLNVVDFGAFVDIGMHDSGLVHVSQMADRFVRDPHEVVAVGDVVKVWVLEVDKARRRVSLTMIPPGHARQGPHRHGRGEDRPRGAPGAARPQTSRPATGAPREGQVRPEGTSGPAGPGTQGPRQRRERPPFVHRPTGKDGPHPPKGPPPHRPKPRPLTPLTDDMKAGKEPLRSFGDLLQFYELQHGKAGKKEDPSKKDQGKRPEGRRKDEPRKKNDSGRLDQATPTACGDAPAETPPASPGPGVLDGPPQAPSPQAAAPDGPDHPEASGLAAPPPVEPPPPEAPPAPPHP